MKSIYEIRKRGKEFCQTDGSEHYKNSNDVEPLDLIIALGYGEGFCMGSAIKYASRFNKTKNPEDLKKISDYAQILAGVVLVDKEEKVKRNIKGYCSYKGCPHGIDKDTCCYFCGLESCRDKCGSCDDDNPLSCMAFIHTNREEIND